MQYSYGSKLRRTALSVAAGVLAIATTVAAQSTPNVQLSVIPGTEATPGANNVPLRFMSVGDATTASAFDLAAESDLWSLTFKSPPAGCGVPTPAPIFATPTSPQCTFASFQFYPAMPGSFLAVWNEGHHASMHPKHSFTVYVHGVAAAGTNVYELRIQVVTNTPTLTLAEVDFPRLEVKSRNLHRGLGSAAGEMMAVPNAQGAALIDPVSNLLPFAPLPFMFHPGRLSMQWTAYCSTSETNAPVLFFGSRDTVGHSKEFLIGPSTAQGFKLGVRHSPEGNTVVDNDYLSPYASVVGVVRGDWYDGAQEYRNWLLTRPAGQRPTWLADANGNYLKPLAQRAANNPVERPLPSLLRDAEMIFTYDEPSAARNFSGWAGDANDQKTFYGANVVPSIVFHPHTIQSPGVPATGTGDWHLWAPSFLAALPHTATAWGPYMSIEGYDTRATTYLNPGVPGFTGSVDQYRLIDANGCPVMYDPYTPRLCNAFSNGAGQRFGGELAKKVAADAATRGARNLYLDEFTYEGGFPCYGAGHGHPVGGGSYMTAARRATVDELLTVRRTADPAFFVSSESPTETFSDVVQLAFEHASPDKLVDTGRSLPMFSAVYHDFQLTSRILWVSNSPAGLFNHAFARRQVAYAGYFGDIPAGGSVPLGDLMATNLADPNFLRAALLLKSTVGVTKQAAVRPYFHTGRRLRDVPHTAPRIPSATGYKGLYGAWIDANAEQPTVYVSTWADPTLANSFGLMVTNWTDAVDTFPPSTVVGGLQNITATIDAAKLGVLPGNYDVTLVTETAQIPLGVLPINPTLAVPVTIPPLSTLFIRFTKI